jgi:AAA+ ATPase superfamily predicted ATPase
VKKQFANPFTPGAGHSPPYLAGREEEKAEFKKLLQQTIVMSNPILSGLRGVGKTVLLEELKSIAIAEGWYWVGTDMSETASLTEQNLATRLLADLAVVTSQFVIAKKDTKSAWFHEINLGPDLVLGYDTLLSYYNSVPGLVTDKLKAVLEIVGRLLAGQNRGLIFAYDEAQNLSDHAKDKEFPLSLVLDVFQSLQRKNHRFLLTLAGLPTLYPKLVEARTSAERMFRVTTMDRLDNAHAREAITKPIAKSGSPYPLGEALISEIVAASGGYPYFIQFICREVYDAALQRAEKGEALKVSIPDIVRKLDADFFAGRWAKATERQRDLLGVIASLDNMGTDFSVGEVVEKAKILVRQKQLTLSFSASHINQMLKSLADTGFVFKEYHGKYRFAVPLLGQFIRRQTR